MYVSARPDVTRPIFNPRPTISAVPLVGGQSCIVVDDALVDPHALVAWCGRQSFQPPAGYPYPGLVLPAPAADAQRVSEFFALHARGRLGARRTLDVSVRLSLVTTPPGQLEPRQWQCHRDRVAQDGELLYAASVLYLFEDPALGGTSFYVPRQSPQETDRLVADSQSMDAAAFGARYGLQAGYMAGSNAYFERVAEIPAAWNRMIFYDGGIFHSGDVGAPDRLSADPARGRLTLNGFFTCRRNAR
jgi:hypothetical protein